MPIVFDVSEDRHRLELIMEKPESIIWELGDITDFNRLEEVAEKYDVEAIIHLAALRFHSVKDQSIVPKLMYSVV